MHKGWQRPAMCVVKHHDYYLYNFTKYALFSDSLLLLLLLLLNYDLYYLMDSSQKGF